MYIDRVVATFDTTLKDAMLLIEVDWHWGEAERALGLMVAYGNIRRSSTCVVHKV